ncbi:MAG: peptidoglycan DD-metalloendopeptidase family protein [Chloroflexota bacterium]
MINGIEDPSPSDDPLHYFPTPPAPPAPAESETSIPGSPSRWQNLWQDLTEFGLAETVSRWGSHIILFVMVMLVIWAMPGIYNAMYIEFSPSEAYAAPAITPTPDISLAAPSPAQSGVVHTGIPRRVQMHTSLPARSRFEVVKYRVQPGDTLFGIAEKFGLKPETILWGNQFVLGDNPHNLRPDQELNILPVDGTYYKWAAGDGLNGVAEFFGVKPEDIINWPGNHLEASSIGDYAHPNIEPGTWLIIPGGKRSFVTWSAPEIPRDNPGVAQVLGTGACKEVADGAIGVGLFIWPTARHFISGFDYSPSTNHFGIDIDGDTGNAVYAVDNGVIVYAGWNNWGYGNVIVINHGNGWQTLYAHLSAINVTCGQSVYQSNVIGAIGSTGNSSGSHLHFEMMYNGTKVNPWDYLPPP